MKTCESCGRVMINENDFGGKKTDNEFCTNCTDEFGHLLSKKKVIQSVKDLLVKQMLIRDEVAEQMVKENLKNSAIWSYKKKIAQSTDNFVITDIGSTTTKAILVTRNKTTGKIELCGPEVSQTTVEIPNENVMIGVYHAIKNLEKSCGVNLLTEKSVVDSFSFLPGIAYLTTSSAGGGLQILVIGLTTFDSASSAQRAAYGAGGVLLDVIAIDDKRSNLEKISAIHSKNPDIILFSGGFDNGAVQTLTRLSEILALSEPLPKFGSRKRIPLIYAGNADAIPFVENTLAENYELFVLPNLRPSALTENLLPVRHIINQIFMEKVMEYAPGYSHLKELIADKVIPTPNGVMNTLEIIGERYKQNIMCVDIGGATTDVFSNILGNFYRTVSANTGMSYSMSNVLKEAGINEIKQWLPDSFDEKYIRNYISNKTLFTGTIPSNDMDLAIEHAVSREALKIAKEQHMQMHFNTVKIGFLDKMKLQDLDKYIETFYTEKMETKRYFHNKDISILIGAGSVISKAKTIEQAAIQLIDGLEPEGITDLVRDHNFIMPHLGILSNIDSNAAESLIFESCLEKLLTHIRPLSEKWKTGKSVMSIAIKSEYFNKEMKIITDDFLYFRNPDHIRFEIKISLEKGFFLKNDEKDIFIETMLPVIVDCRIPGKNNIDKVIKELKLYDFKEIVRANLIGNYFPIKDGTAKIELSLPYEGDLLVRKSDQINPGQLLGENKYDPPKIYIVSLLTSTGIKAAKEDLKKFLLIKPGDVVENGQLILDMRKSEKYMSNLLDELSGVIKIFHSNVRGLVEKINYDTGVIVLREIQDYPEKPFRFNISEQICVEKDKIKPYLKKAVGDFVYKGEVIASRIDKQEFYFSYSPATGNITDINYKDGSAVIRYERKGFKIVSHFSGQVIETRKNKTILCECRGIRVPALVGFGCENGGRLYYQVNSETVSSIKGKVVAVKYAELSDLISFKNAEIAGLILSSINEKTMSEFSESELSMAFTGNELLPFPIIILNGFGMIDFSPEQENVLKRSVDSWVYIHPKTQVRAGVIRPFLLIQGKQ